MRTRALCRPGVGIEGKTPCQDLLHPSALTSEGGFGMECFSTGTCWIYQHLRDQNLPGIRENGRRTIYFRTRDEWKAYILCVVIEWKMLSTRPRFVKDEVFSLKPTHRLSNHTSYLHFQ